MRKYFAVMLTLALTVSLCACSARTENGNGITISETGTQITAESTLPTDVVNITALETDADDKQLLSASDVSATKIALASTTVSVAGKGASVSGSTVTITSAGKYIVRGTLSDGQIIVNTADKATVYILFNGVDISCSSSAPFCISDAKKVVLTLSGSNTITDTANYVFASSAETEPDASLFCKSDLTVNGSGTLTVNADFNDGIKCKDILKILGGSITVNSVDDGIIGRDAVIVDGVTLNVNAGGDGIKTTNVDDSSLGYISVSSGTYNVTSGNDAFQAVTNLLISDGSFNITTGGGSANASQLASSPDFGGFSSSPIYTDTEESSKALKASSLIEIKGGSFKIDSCDDAIHSNNAISVSGGSFEISSGDDGLHADTAIEINGGRIAVSKAYEGIESTTITVNDGEITLNTSDDGINVYGGNDASALGGRPGQNAFNASAADSSRIFTMNGGSLYVNADGDGLDSNGAILVTGGTILVDGPTNNGNGALDYTTGCTVNGGTLIAAGSAGMAQSVGASSKVYSLTVTLNAQQSAQTLINVTDADGNEVLTYKPSKVYQTVIICSPSLKSGEKYTVYYGGTHSGISENGLMNGGGYSEGTKLDTVTLSSAVTSVGASAGIGMGGQGFGGGIPPGGGKMR